MEKILTARIDGREMEDDFEGAAQAQFSLQVQFLESFFQQLIPDMTDFELTVLSGLIIKTYNAKELETPHGTILIEGPVLPENLEKYEFDESVYIPLKNSISKLFKY